jgi:hypothetical protein
MANVHVHSAAVYVHVLQIGVGIAIAIGFEIDCCAHAVARSDKCNDGRDPDPDPDGDSDGTAMEPLKRMTFDRTPVTNRLPGKGNNKILKVNATFPHGGREGTPPVPLRRPPPLPGATKCHWSHQPRSEEVNATTPVAFTLPSEAAMRARKRTLPQKNGLGYASKHQVSKREDEG